MSKSKIATIWELIRIPLIILVGVFVLLQLKSCYNKIRTEDQNGTAQSDSANYYRDRYNNEHAQVGLLNSNIVTIKSSYAALLASKAAELKTSQRNIKGITNFATAREFNLDSIISLYTHTDTIRVKGKDSIIHTTHNVYVPIMDSLSITQYLRRINLFRSAHMLDVVSYSNDVRERSIQGFQVKQYRNNLNIGPTLSWTATANGMRVLPGIGLQYSLIGIHVGKKK